MFYNGNKISVFFEFTVPTTTINHISCP